MFASTIADLSFVTWDAMVPWIYSDSSEGMDIEKDYPTWSAWNKRLMARPAVAKVFKDKQAAMSG